MYKKRAVKVPFLEPRLVGARFENHSVPLEILRDWASFEELIVETARWIYLQEHPKKSRVPKGFASGFSLHLSGINEGSAKPVLERVITNGELPFDDYFNGARDRVIKAMQIAAGGGNVAEALGDTFPLELCGYFDEFGRSLREEERVEFPSLDDVKIPVVYNREVRKRLVLAAASEYRNQAGIRGSVSQVDVEKRSFILRRINGTHIPGRFSSELQNVALKALAVFETTKVLVQGVVVFDRNDSPVKIESSTHIEFLEQNDIPARIEELELLEDGWNFGSGKALATAGLSWLSSSWEKHFPDGLPAPYLYPTPESGLQAEWSTEGIELSLEIDLIGRCGEALKINLKDRSQEFEPVHLDFKDEAGWSQLAALVKESFSA